MNKNKKKIGNDPGNYDVLENELVCKTCGARHALWACKCGKTGPAAYIINHLLERYAKGTKSALEAHGLVRPDLSSLEDGMHPLIYERHVQYGMMTEKPQQTPKKATPIKTIDLKKRK